MNKKKIGILSTIIALTLVVALSATFIYKQSHKPRNEQARDAVEEYLNEYSASMQEYAAGDSGENSDPVYVLTKEESSTIAEDVYKVLQEDLASDNVDLSEEKVLQLEDKIYKVVSEQLLDKVPSEVVDKTTDNITALVLAQIYEYSDQQDEIVRQALEGKLGDMADDMLDIDSKIAIAQNDCDTLNMALTENASKNEADLKALNSSYSALKDMVNKNASSIYGYKASISALDKTNKELADRLNTIVTDDITAGGDKALSATAGKNIVDTMNNLYDKSASSVNELNEKIDSNAKDIEIALENVATSANKDLSELANVVSANNVSVRNDLDKIIDDLKNSDENNINDSILSMNEKLLEYMATQNTDINDTIAKLQEMYNNASDPESATLIQNLLNKLKEVNSEADATIINICKLITEYEANPSEEKLSNILIALEDLKATQPDVYNRYVEYISELKNGDTTHISNLRNELTKVYKEHVANYNAILAECLNIINGSELKDTELGKQILGMFKELQSSDTSSVQNILMQSILNLSESATKDQATIIASINEAISTLAKSNQDTDNALSQLNNKLSEDIVKAYNSLSSDLKSGNMDLTKQIYDNYIELYGMNQESTNVLSNNLTTVESTLRKMNEDTNVKLSEDLAALSVSFNAINAETLEQLRNEDEESYNALVALLDKLEEAKNSDVATLRSESATYYTDMQNTLDTARTALEKQAGDDYSDLIGKLTATSDELSKAQTSSANSLLEKLEGVKTALASEDEANKQAAYEEMNKLNKALQDADASILSTLREESGEALDGLEISLNTAINSKYAELLQADKDNLEALANASSELQRQVSGNSVDISGLSDELNNFKSQYETDKASHDTQMQQVFQSVSDGKSGLASAITDRGISTAQDATFDVLSRNIKTIGSEGTATAPNILEGKTVYSDGSYITGSMSDQGTKEYNLNAGESVTLPDNVHFDKLKISAATLAEQTSGNATAGDILSGKTAYINGSKVTGSMPNNGAINKSINAGGSVTIPAGYTSGGTISVASLASITAGTATSGDILRGKTAYVNGQKITGSIADCGTAQYASTVNACPDYVAMAKIPEGYYHSTSGTESWAPEIRVTYDQLRNALGITADKIVSGQSIAGVQGTAYKAAIVECTRTSSVSTALKADTWYDLFDVLQNYTFTHNLNLRTHYVKYYGVYLYIPKVQYGFKLSRSNSASRYTQHLAFLGSYDHPEGRPTNNNEHSENTILWRDNSYQKSSTAGFTGYINLYTNTLSFSRSSDSGKGWLIRGDEKLPDVYLVVIYR